MLAEGRNHMRGMVRKDLIFLHALRPLDIWVVGSFFHAVALSIDRVDLELLLSGCCFGNSHYNALTRN